MTVDPITADFFAWLREVRKKIPGSPPVMTDEELAACEAEVIDNDQECINNGINL